ncbi:hypothetical protein PhCBS80983_g01303 [Powellomyces hirtus]|uniref:DH domain-containing protein n=1 Tax=Powellomyces hirtus TaxID=109895 RepID=A0A507EBN7_9FUNG|nr:hypothetical protein PhCBS80983_g01303 [Powellomyces hirtus]
MSHERGGEVPNDGRGGQGHANVHGVPQGSVGQPHLNSNYRYPQGPHQQQHQPHPYPQPIPRYQHHQQPPPPQQPPQHHMQMRPAYMDSSPPHPHQMHPVQPRPYYPQPVPQNYTSRPPYMGPPLPPSQAQHLRSLARSNTGYRPPPPPQQQYQQPHHHLHHQQQHSPPPRIDSQNPLPHVYAPPPQLPFRPYPQPQHPSQHSNLGPNRTVAPHPFQSHNAVHSHHQPQQPHHDSNTPFAIPQYRLPHHLQQQHHHLQQQGHWTPPSPSSASSHSRHQNERSDIINDVRLLHHPTPPPRVDSDPSETTTLANVPRRHSVASTADSATFLPVIYPAMLSMVAEAFRNKVPLGNRVKDSLDYNDCFVGREAVDTIAYLIKSTDRNLSLLLGRALDAQKFFHDVTYNHRLRDSSNELYKFQAPVATGSNGELARPAADADPEDGGLPNGVFTLLTDCYSPTCTRDRLCYSIACPRRLEQQTRLLSSTTSQLQRSPSRVSMTELDKKHALWSTSVSKEIVESVSDNERKRQEVIFETIQTEREFVADLDIIERVFVEPLRRSDIIPVERLDIFIEEVFFNINELHAINSRLLTKLIARQKEGSIVDKIGDIFVSVVDEFEAYVRYGGQQVLAKYALDQEKATNPEFAKFLQECERVPECRKLPIQSFLARPTTRIGRYPLLLKSAMTAAADHHPDRTLLPQAMHVIKEVLTNINREAGRAENQLKLEQLQMSLVFNPGEVMDLGLNRPETLIVREGHLVLRKNAGSEIDLQVFLFDHMLLLTKVKKAGLHKVYKRPIPLEFLVIGENHNNASRRASGLFSSGHKASPSGSFGHSHSNSATKSSSMNSSGVTRGGGGAASDSNSFRSNTVSGSPLPAVIPAPTSGFPFTILHLGRDGGSYTLYAANQAERRTWRDVIEQQKALLTDRRKRFELASVCESYFPAHNRVNSSTVYKDQLLLGTDMGLFVGPLNPFASSTEGSVESASPDGVPLTRSSSAVSSNSMSKRNALNPRQHHLAQHHSQPQLQTRRPSSFDLLNPISASSNHLTAAGSLAGFRKVVDLEKISQVDVLPNHNMITLLAERALWTYPLDVLNEAQSPSAGVTAAGTSVASSAIAARAKGEKISAHLNFYKNGVCKDRTFISGVRLTALNSTVKIYEPVGAGEVKRRGKIGKFFAGAETSVKTFKEFYIPAEASSIHYLRTKLCVGCSKGFEVVDLETLMPQGLIDAEDDRMDFVNKREGLKPISIFRLGSGDFLLCYNEFGFYIDRFGSRTKGDALIQWAGYPTSFTFSSPYIIAYEPSFIEIRNVETTLLQQIIPTANLRTLNSETRHVVVEALHAPDMQNVCRLVQVENTSSPTTEGGETEKYKQAHRSNGKVEDDNSSVNSDLPPYSF